VDTSSGPSKSLLMPYIVLLATTVVNILGLTVVVLDASNLYAVGWAFSLLLFAALIAGQSVTIGGKKLV
jgi:hypothetical protein